MIPTGWMREAGVNACTGGAMATTDEQSSSTDDGATRRREIRLGIKGLRLPFLGTRLETRGIFPYVLLDISTHGARIILPDWAVRRELLHAGEHIDFHLPFMLDGVTYNQGRVAWTQRDDIQYGQVCGVDIETRSALYYPVFLELKAGKVAIDLHDMQSSERLLLRILKDTILLKRGILIYFGHFKPIVQRMIRSDPERAAMLRSYLFEDTESRVERNIAALERQRLAIEGTDDLLGELATVLDLDALRVLMEPEIEPMVWISTFSEGLMREYLSAIMSLEAKIFYNFNTIVMIYADALMRSIGVDSMETHHGS
ncbi:PilZ domain-containing protein [Thiocapsa rosea]|uniref:PilZ domain-containing protein n=1 Tax=Thiocapsa rosea TaxID=69360 RepID=A0A495VB14_9GAMM|nr:PilZ domain-containing protein [Thiocapsa rosea]RKT46586.1 PilZ domain-containing protein [Thiocapsa rosea]